MPAPSATADHLHGDEGPLHVMVETVQCALSGCVPCCAKVLINQQGAWTSLPNARPETCFRLVRAANSAKMPRVISIGLYRQGQSILTVGDGDFSFSLALARALKGARVVATSYESHASLAKVYGAVCTDALRELEQLGAVVAHGVDAAELGTTLPVGAVPTGGFDRVVWNFPCVARGTDGAVMSGAGAGADARGSADIEANRRLVARFCTGGAALLAAQGELHITHKVGLQQWHIEQQGLQQGLQQEQQEAAQAAATGAGVAGPLHGPLEYAGAVAFDRAAYPPYRPRKALTAKGFPTTDARTFVFARCGTTRGGGGGAAACGATLADPALVQQLSAQVVQAVCSRHGLAPARAAAPAAPAAPASSSDEGADRRGRELAVPGMRKRSADQVSASASRAAPAAVCARAAPAAASSQKKKKQKKKQRSASASLQLGAAGVGVRRGACVGTVD